MILSTWLTVVTICILGAMSPGPSLALVLKHTLGGGRRNGMITGICHGLGVGLYAMLTVLGLAAVITASPLLFHTLQWAGALYLAWIGVHGLMAKPRTIDSGRAATSALTAARDGFLMAFLNPKGAVFFIALFSQVVSVDTSLIAKMGYALTATIIDISWYVIVAWLFSRPQWLAWLQRNTVWIDRIFGVILLALAAKLVTSII